MQKYILHARDIFIFTVKKNQLRSYSIVARACLSPRKSTQAYKDFKKLYLQFNLRKKIIKII